MEKPIFGFFFFVGDGLSHIKEILREGKMGTGEDGALMLTSVHHWLKEKKPINAISTAPLVPEWGLGFRLSSLEKIGLSLQLCKYENNDKLILLKIPPHFAIEFCKLDPKRDVVVLCPSLKERKRYFEVEERYKSRCRSFPIWHWMSISKEDILEYNRDDVSIDRYLNSHFDVYRNYREEDLLQQEEELF